MGHSPGQLEPIRHVGIRNRHCRFHFVHRQLLVGIDRGRLPGVPPAANGSGSLCSFCSERFAGFLALWLLYRLAMAHRRRSSREWIRMVGQLPCPGPKAVGDADLLHPRRVAGFELLLLHQRPDPRVRL
jgi:hypothetical protein